MICHATRRIVRLANANDTKGRTAQKFVGFGINHSLTILRSTVAALFSHSYGPPWGIAAFCRRTEVVAAAGVIFSIASSWFMLSTRIGRADGYFYGPYRTECRSQHRLAGGFD
jgi:hypothetical protein